MKYNPVINEELARLPGFAGLHPLVPDRFAQGALELMAALEDALRAVSGLDAVCLQPSAGAQGELLGMQLVRAHHIDQRQHAPARADPGERARDESGERRFLRLRRHRGAGEHARDARGLGRCRAHGRIASRR